MTDPTDAMSRLNHAEIAAEMLSRGLSVLPVGAKTKTPDQGFAWKSLQARPLRVEDAAKIFTPGKSVAIICGRVSGQVEVIDFDYMARAFAKYKALVEERAPGLLAKLTLQKTQSGGLHIAYRVGASGDYTLPGNGKLTRVAFEVGGPKDGGGETKTDANGRVNIRYYYHYSGAEGELPITKEEYVAGGGTSEKFLEAREVGDKWYVFACVIETKGEGGYFLASPSAGYQLVQGSFLDLAQITLEERQILMDCALELDEEAFVRAQATHTEAKKQRPRKAGEIRPGDRFNQLADMRTILERQGWTPHGGVIKIKGVPAQQWTRPGKEDIGGVSATQFLDKDSFFVFTTSADPLEGQSSYDTFGLYTHYYHNGDFTAAAGSLVGKGVIPEDCTASGEEIPFDCRPTEEELADRFAALQEEITNSIDARYLTNAMVKTIASSGLSASDKEMLFQAIKAKTKLSIAVLRQTAKDFIQQETQEEEALCHLDAARAVIDTVGLENLIFTEGNVYAWNKDVGVWEIVNEKVTSRLVQHSISSKAHRQISSSFNESVAKLLRNELAKKGSASYKEVNPFNRLENAINVENGTLVYMPWGEWVFQDHRKEDMLTTILPVKYDPEAKSPYLDKYLEDSFAGEPDAEDKIACLMEFFAYVLMPHAKYEKFLVLYGPTRTGKSTAMEALEALVGNEGTCGVQPCDWDNVFHVAQMHNKLLNSVDELDAGKKIPDGMLKKVTSGRVINASHKNQDPFNFRPFCKLLIGTNNLPRFRDRTSAIFERALFISFNNYLTKEKRDPNVKDALQKDELPGVLNRILPAYARLVDNNGRFTEPASSTRERGQWRRDANFFVEFKEDMLVDTPEGWITTGRMYEVFKKWMEREGLCATTSDGRSKKVISHREVTGGLKDVGVAYGKDPSGTHRAFRGVDFTDAAKEAFGLNLDF